MPVDPYTGRTHDRLWLCEDCQEMRGTSGLWNNKSLCPDCVRRDLGKPPIIYPPIDPQGSPR